VADHWHKLYNEALLNSSRATNASVRSAYSQLADHYLSMIRFTEGRRPSIEVQAFASAGLMPSAGHAAMAG
jgi:hypothetical protein